MQGNPHIIEALSAVLKAELGAINQYFLHAEMQENWGYHRLSKTTKKESIDEMKHAEQVLHRILFLEGVPNMNDYPRLLVGADVKAQLDNDLATEYQAVKRLNEAISLCRQEKDNGTEELLEKILVDEEEHVDYLEAQLELIRQVGLENFLAQQIHES